MENPIEKTLGGNTSESGMAEKKRELLAQEVRGDLEKYKDQLIQFNLLTDSAKARGFWNTNESVRRVQYDSRYDQYFEFYKLERSDDFDTKTGYIYATDENKATIQAYLGKCLPPEDREGNILQLTLKFAKGFNPRDLLNKIGQLMDTVAPYTKANGGDNTQGIINICKESITVLEAFEDVSEKFPSNGHISVKSMIEEYKEVIVKLS